MNKKINESFYDVVIVGGGPAGLTAGIYLARACYRVLIIEKEKFGGQITITSEVVNYPGIEKISGEKLTDKMRKQAENFGAEFMLAEVSDIIDEGDIKTIICGNKKIECFGVLLATGAHPRMIGFEGEEKYKGHGVAYCATCDGEFFTGKEVFVIGGGFAAAEESVFLTKYAKHITMLIREDDFTCAKAVADKARENDKITIITNVEVEWVQGDEFLRSIKYKSNISDKEYVYEVKGNDTFGVFVFAGYAPATKLVSKLVKLNEQGYIETDINQRTSVEGIYAAGDVCVKSLRQVVTATGDGALAATELEHYTEGMRRKTGLKPVFSRKPKKAETDNHNNADNESGSIDKSSSSSEDLFNEEVVEQLKKVFEKFERPLILKIYRNNSKTSRELEYYMEELIKYTDKLEIEKISELEIKDKIKGNDKDKFSEEQLPYVKVCHKNGEDVGIAFHGVPGGHEFTSFIMGLYNASGEGQRLEEEVRDKIKAINHTVNIKIIVSLSCTMCPELVMSAYRIAVLNQMVTVDVYDIGVFPAYKEKYNIMSVPCMIINDNKPHFGKKNISQLIELLY
ncbi:MAG: FAD-dependent oxidoreductase [Lachnospiraceae bacterium]|nr:FAD-dependent oxidoreductase [Lachnospiraceae bacterium]